MAYKKFSELTPQTISDDSHIHFLKTINGKTGNYRTTFRDLKDAVNSGVSNYIDIVASDGQIYRMTLNKEGEPVFYKQEAYTGEAPDAATSYATFYGLLINQIYGGGNNKNNTPCSHSFIEIYNNSMTEKNLKGLFVSYKGATGNWISHELVGIVPPQHSYLIRCKQVSDMDLLATRMKVDYYDSEWDIELPDKGFSVYLSVGLPDDSYKNPWNFDGMGGANQPPGYIDLFAAGGITTDLTVQAYEGGYSHLMTKDVGARRLDFYQTMNKQGVFAAGASNNAKDDKNKECSRAVDWTTCNIELFRPRCLKDGKWDIYHNKIKLKENVPNLMNITYGIDGETTRTFTWQSVATEEGWLRYRKLGENRWHIVESERVITTQPDVESTIHRCIIRDLAPGTYEYQAGEEGMWSDVATFEVKKYGTTEPMNIIWTSDQQGWHAEEYIAWKVAYQNILDLYEKEGKEWDFALNTGDISQNGNRSFEWRYYFQHAQEMTRNGCHVITCGNNDLVDKIHSYAFDYYTSPEQKFLSNEQINADTHASHYTSVHSWDLGYVHFVCLNSNNKAEDMIDLVAQMNAKDEGTIDEWIQAQCQWLEADLEANLKNPNNRWTIVYMHYSPFTCVRADWLQRYIPTFEKYRVNLVLCGHNHTYSRSIPINSGYPGTPNTSKYDGTGVKTAAEETNMCGATISHAPDANNGVVYLMCQATGFKNSGKEGLQTVTNNASVNNNASSPWWYAYTGSHPSQPSFITLDITPDKITSKAYRIDGILGKDANNITIVKDYGQQELVMFDSVVINYRPKGKK